jgi:xanthine/CO dehydrogenase XdhC/CoxF family maturation factor
MAHEIGWSTTVTDDCIAHLTPRRFSSADAIIYSSRDTIKEKLPINNRTAAILISHNYKYDLKVLAELIDSPAPYIGILGPKKRYEKMSLELGINNESQISKRIHAPIGLDIGAETPEEIAISILGEIKSFFAKRNGGNLKERKGPIHVRESIEFTNPNSVSLEQCSLQI